jgi:hypothetical protein
LKGFEGRRKWLALVGAIACGMIVVVAASVYLTRPSTSSTQTTKPVGDFGPKVLLSGAANPAAIANNTTVSIQVYSAVPSAFETSSSSSPLNFYTISAQNQWANGGDEELLNVTLVPQGAFDNGVFTNATSFFLAPTFDSIADEWSELLSHDSGKNFPSVTVVAEKTVAGKAGVAIYRYYDNLLYNPFSLQVLGLSGAALSGAATSWFQGTDVNPSNYSSINLAALAVNLSVSFSSVAAQVIPQQSNSFGTETGSSVALSPGAGPISTVTAPDSTAYFYTYPITTGNLLVHASYAYGTLPLMGVTIGPNADSGDSEIALYATTLVLNDTISLNSNEVYAPVSGQVTTTMSTSPSFSHMANISVGTGGGGSDAVPFGISKTLGNNLSVSLNRTTAFVGIQGVEYEFAHYSANTYDWKYEWEQACGVDTCNSPQLISETLESTVLDGDFTTGGIVHINSTAGLQVSAEYQSIWVAWAFQEMLSSSTNGTISLTPSGADSGYVASTIWGETTGYNNAASVYGQLAGALSTFSTAMDASLLIIGVGSAASGLTFDASEPVVVAAVTSVVSVILDLSPMLLNQFSSISFISGPESSTFISGFNNVPLVGSGSNYSMPFYESSTPISLIAGGNTYSFYAPVDYLDVTAL